MRRALAATALLLSLGAARPARATTIQDTISGVKMELAAQGAVVCVVLPRAVRDTSGCPDLDVAAVEASLRDKADLIGFAVVRYPDWAFLFTLGARQGMSMHTSEDIEAYLKGVAKGVGPMGTRAVVHGDALASKYDIGKVNGVDFVRCQVDVEAAAETKSYKVSRMLIYMLAGRDATASVAFATDPDHAAQLRPIAGAIIDTVSMRPLGLEDFGKSQSYMLGKAVGQLVVSVGVLLAVVFGIIAAVRGSRKKPERSMMD